MPHSTTYQQQKNPACTPDKTIAPAKTEEDRIADAARNNEPNTESGGEMKNEGSETSRSQNESGRGHKATSH